MPTTDTPSLSTLAELGGTELIDAAIATLGVTGVHPAGKAHRGIADPNKARSHLPDDAEESAAEPDSSPDEAASPADQKPSLDTLVEHIRSLTVAKGSTAEGEHPNPNPLPKGEGNKEKKEHFVPQEPKSFHAAGLNDNLVEALTLKFLMARGDCTGREIADQLKLPFLLVDELLRRLKSEQLLGYRGGASMNDFVYQLTDVGRERAKRYWNHSTYFGAAPVSLEDYVASVKAQSLVGQQTTAEHLRKAFGDLVLGQKMLDRLGPAVNSGRGLFLFGAAGNGKTSIAERVTLRVRPGDLGAPSHGHRRRNHAGLRSGRPRRDAAGAVRRRLRPSQDRPSLGPHPPAHDHRRR